MSWHLVPKKWHAGKRYRLEANLARMVDADINGIVDIPRSFRFLRSEHPRWLGYAMGVVKDDDARITWDVDAMAKR